MPVKCQNCNCVTHKQGATACLICGTPFENASISVQTKGLVVAPAAGPTLKITDDIDQRNWLVRALNRRAKYGISLGVIFTLIGRAGGGIVKGNVLARGKDLILLGIFIAALGVVLAYVTRRRTL